jgi:hypothetical protein
MDVVLEVGPVGEIITGDVKLIKRTARQRSGGGGHTAGNKRLEVMNALRAHNHRVRFEHVTLSSLCCQQTEANRSVAMETLKRGIC